jgi:hypothetical protein
MFTQNNGISGFQKGAYCSKSIQPTTVNWTRQSGYRSIKNPQLKWSCHLNDTIVPSSPVIGDEGTIYFGGSSGNLFAVLPTGDFKWIKKLEGILETPVIHSNNRIIIGSRNGILYAVSLNGEVDWYYKTSEMIEFSPAIASDGTIYSVSHNTLYAIDSNGQKKWEYRCPFDGIFWSSPTVAIDGTIFIGKGDKLLAIDSEGYLRWSVVIGDAYASAPVITKDGTVLINGAFGDIAKLYAITAQGKKRWEFLPDLGSISTSPALSNTGVLFTGSDIFEIYSIDLYGKLLWHSKIQGFMYYPPVITSDGLVYITSSNEVDGKWLSWVESFDLRGTETWFITLDGVATVPALGEDGTLYLLAEDYDKNTGILYAYGSNKE